MQTKTNLPSPTGYAGIVTKPPEWHTLVVFDILFNNLTTGLFLVAAVGELAAPATFTPVATWAYPVALALLLADFACLVLDLGDSLRFHHMLRVFKPSSPMSLGTWLVILFTGFAFVSFLDALIARRLFTIGGWRYDRTLHGTPLGLVWSLVGGLLGLAVGIYSGVLLTVGNFAGWGDTWMIPAVWVSTALITGVAAVVLVQALLGDADADMVSLAQTNTWLIAWWLVNVVVFLLTLAGGGGAIFLTGVPLLAILAAIVLAGIIPLVMNALRPVGSKDTLAFAAALVLVGGFLMRFGIVMGPQVH